MSKETLAYLEQAAHDYLQTLPERGIPAEDSMGPHGPGLTRLRELADAEPDVESPDEREGPAGLIRLPSWYTRFVIEPITFIMMNGLNFWQGNIIKYTCRAGLKLYDGMDEVQSEITDLEKTRRYAEMRINQLKGKEVL